MGRSAPRISRLRVAAIGVVLTGAATAALSLAATPVSATPSPSSGAPSSGAPTSGAPTSGAPTSGAPTSGAPTSGAPTSGAPTSGAPSSGAPSSAPSSGAPSSGAPSSGAPKSGDGSGLLNQVVSPLRKQLGAEMQQAKDAADRHVATVQLSVGQQADLVARRTATASAAEQDYTAQLAVQQRARAALAGTAQRLATARAAYRYDYRAFAAAAVSAYESDSAPGALGSNVVGSLLVVDDPSGVLNLTAEHQMVADHQANTLGRVKLALARVSVAKADRAHALAATRRVTARLAALQSTAGKALSQARRALTQLRAQLAGAKRTQSQADAALNTFLGGWSAGDPVAADALNKRYERIAKRLQTAPVAPPGPIWTAAMGRTVVARALQTIGTPYAWAGGSPTGPTRGRCVAGPAHNDCHLIGFDCSGLALFSWSPYLSMPHSAEQQYRFGSVHPSPGELKPGDLVFWSSNSAVSGIHHVAIYVGDGNVIQAPDSGDIVRITPLSDVSRGYFGATRPLS